MNTTPIKVKSIEPKSDLLRPHMLAVAVVKIGDITTSGWIIRRDLDDKIRVSPPKTKIPGETGLFQALHLPSALFRQVCECIISAYHKATTTKEGVTK